MTSLCCPNFGNGFRSYAGRLPKFRHSSNHQARLSLFSFELEIVLGEVLQIRRLGTSPQRNYFQRNSCKLTIKVVQVGGCGLLLRWYILNSIKFI
ncbi:hypothetical protein ACS0TY_018014 [Phlomoides rotata]